MKLRLLLAVIVTAALTSLTAGAHHSFPATYHVDQEVTIPDIVLNSLTGEFIPRRLIERVIDFEKNCPIALDNQWILRIVWHLLFPL